MIGFFIIAIIAAKVDYKVSSIKNLKNPDNNSEFCSLCAAFLKYLCFHLCINRYTKLKRA